MPDTRAVFILSCLAFCAQLPSPADAADKVDKKVVAFFKAVKRNLAESGGGEEGGGLNTLDAGAPPYMPPARGGP
jgi:hypothetical protein